MGILDFDDEWEKNRTENEKRDDASLYSTLAPMITGSKKAKVDGLMRNEGWSARRAFEHVGVLICIR